MSSQKSVLDIHALAPEILVHQSALVDALAEVEAAINDSNIEFVINDLLSKPNLLEFVMSASPPSANRLARYILDNFPVTADAFSTSLAHTLLQRFLLFLFGLRRSFPPEIYIDKYRQTVGCAPQVLAEISAMLTCDVLASPAVSNGSRYQGNRARRSSTVTLNIEPFRKLDVSVPNTQQAAHQLATSILGDLKQILESFLTILRRPDLAPIFKAEYITNEPEKLADTTSAPDPIATSTTAQESGQGTSSSAYPRVQPMKAALYFDSVDGFGEWRLLMSSRVIQVLRDARRTNMNMFKIIVKKMKELSNGHFSPDNQKKLNGSSVDVPIYEAKMTRDQRLVYQVDCIPEYGTDGERQALRLFGIYTHAQLDRFWDSMGTQLAKKGKEYRRRCNFRNPPHHKGDNVVMPAQFPAQEPDSYMENSVLDLPHEDLGELHSLLVLEKFIDFSQALFNSIIADQNVTHAFSVSPQEKEIIEHNLSCYVLGRSGTGKTTTMLYKMLRIEKAWASSVDFAKPRQLFVTQSRVLAGKVEDYFSKLMDSLATASHSPRELIKHARAKRTQREEKLFVDADDDTEWRNDLPERFSLLEDKHFPLFITFDKLCKLLEAEIAHLIDEETLTMGATIFRNLEFTSPRRTDLPWERKRQPGSIVSYETFENEYWPHFSQSLTKGLDPSLVFSEIMGIIKGSEQALSSTDHCLDRQCYENLSHRSQSTFAVQRSTIYAIFELYLQRKKAEGQYDSADRTHNILSELLARGVPGKIDYLYVDEVQDNLLIDTLLLRSLCRQPGGLFWAGDTAQTISVGSSFRFDDLKAFLFRVEARNTVVAANPKVQAQPMSFQLTVNYRSHGGIVNCAHSVVELITQFWPYAIDTLQKEKGIVDGLKPVFFHGWDSDTVRYEQFLFGTDGNLMDFGARQCILVRDKPARTKLRKQLGKHGIIMTLYESKGLEFDDVLLYNFFDDSAADLSQWRVVLNALKPGSTSSVSAPSFNEIKHAVVCNELKCLYVAITRARNNLWIIDCSQKSEPMRVLWSSRNQVKNCTPDDDVPRFAVSSSPHEWGITGEELFDHKQYLQAMECFERAGMLREVDVCYAYSLREQARAAPISSQRNGNAVAKAAFVVAAEAFTRCAMVATRDKERRAYFRIAGECYVRSDDNPKAAEAFLEAKEYSLAAQHYRKAGLFDSAVQVIQTHKEQIPTHVVDSIVDVARLVYFRDDAKIKQATELFASKEEALDFVADYNFDVAQAALLQDLGNHADAAEVHLAEGRTTQAINIFLNNLTDKECARRATDFVLRGLWERLSFGVAPKDANLDSSLDQWLLLAARLDPALLKPSDHDEIVMFQAILSGNLTQLQQSGLKFHLDDNKPAALLCLDHLHSSPFMMQGETLKETISTLEIFYAYARLLHDLVLTADPCRKRMVQKLFAFSAVRGDSFSVPKGTILYNAIAKLDVRPEEENGEIRLISEAALSQVFKTCLSERLHYKVMEENEVCRRARIFSPCLNALEGTCHRPECHREHVEPGRLTPKWYNDHVRIHLQQILIFQTLHSVDLGPERWWQQRQWLDRLYEALNPYSFQLGSLANLILSRIPEAERGLKVVNDWVRHLIYTSDPRKHSAFLTTFLRVGSLSFTFYRREAFDYIRDARCMNNKPPDILIRMADRVNVVWDFVHAIHGVQPWSLQAGFLFLGHVVRERLPINIGVLCDVVEHICGSLVVTRRSSFLHDITLPRSWILSAYANSETGYPKDTLLRQEFVDTLLILLARISTGFQADHLLFGSLSVSQGAPKNAFIARICRALCLVGLNIVNEELRRNIHRGITSLHIEGRLWPPSYRRYLTALSWDDLARAVLQSMVDSQMEEIIYLCHESKTRWLPRPVEGVRFVVFRHSDEIPALLGSHPTSSLEYHFGPTELADSRNGTGLEDPGVEAPLREKTTPTEDIGGGYVETDRSGDAEAFVHSAGVSRLPDASVAPPEEHVHAARIIQRVYHCALIRRQGGPRSTLAEARSRFFLECRAEANKMESSCSHYRLLFLGPLPHILLCLERAKTCTFQMKANLKKRLRSPEHVGLEDVHLKMTQTNMLIKDLQRLQNALDPKAVVHQHRDLLALKAHVQNTEVIIRGLPCAHELQDDLHIGVKGIVTQKNK